MNKVVDKDLGVILSSLGDQLKKLSGKRIFLSGGAGFLGYYFINFLLYMNEHVDQEPCEVICADNFIRGVPDWLNQLKGNESLQVLSEDIVHFNMDELDSIDYIIHAASIASPSYYRKYPIETMDANIGGLRNVLEYCKSKQLSSSPVGSVLFFSSSEVYGNPSEDFIPTPETYAGNVSFTGPRACYDESKRFGETLCVNFHRMHNIPVKIVRPFNNYGPGLKIDDGRVLSDFCRNIVSGEDIIMLSDGSAKRTFCYIADAITGYLQALLSDNNGESFNIGSESPEISMEDLANLTIQVAGDTLGIDGLQVIRAQSSDENYLVDNPMRRCPDISKARDLLGFEPQVSLETGLKNTLLWYKDARQL